MLTTTCRNSRCRRCCCRLRCPIFPVLGLLFGFAIVTVVQRMVFFLIGDESRDHARKDHKNHRRWWVTVQTHDQRTPTASVRQEEEVVVVEVEEEGPNTVGNQVESNQSTVLVDFQDLDPGTAVGYNGVVTGTNHTGNAFVLPRLDLSSKDRICFVHVGKAGGSTVLCILGIDDHFVCRPNSDTSNLFAPYRGRSAVAKYAGGNGRVHGGKYHCDARINNKAFLTLTRNPIERFYSWFYFAMPKSSKRVTENRKYLWIDCYPSMKEFVHGLEAIDTPTTTNKKKNATYTISASLPDMACPERAWAVVTGSRIVNRWAHNWYNYEYYVDAMRSASALVTESGTATGEEPMWLVLRNEHVADDWDAIETMLGGEGNDGKALFATKLNAHSDETSNATSLDTNNRSLTRDTTTPATDTVEANNDASKPISKAMKELGPGGVRILCRALCRDIQYYKLMLRNAANLSPEQKSQSLQELYDTCPEEEERIARGIGSTSGDDADGDEEFLSSSFSACPDTPRFALVPPDHPYVGDGKPRYKQQQQQQNQQ